MNKKAFIGATLITATVVGGVVYYRHQIRDKVDEALAFIREAQRHPVTRVHRDVDAALKQEPTA